MTKLIQIICAFLVLIAVSSATADFYRDATLEIKSIGSWNQGSMTVTQYAVTINNHTNKVIKSIRIHTDRTLALRDSTSIWNIEKLSNGDLSLPVGQPTIAAKSSHTFYCILKGTTRPNLYVKSISYE